MFATNFVTNTFINAFKIFIGTFVTSMNLTSACCDFGLLPPEPQSWSFYAIALRLLVLICIKIGSFTFKCSSQVSLWTNEQAGRERGIKMCLDSVCFIPVMCRCFLLVMNVPCQLLSHHSRVIVSSHYTHHVSKMCQVSQAVISTSIC